MLASLGPDLAQAVVRHLQPDERGRARLACKALDAAARATCTRLTLTPDNTLGAPPPNWARFPGLAELALAGWDMYYQARGAGAASDEHWTLRSYFLDALPDHVRTLTLDECRFVDAATLALIATRMPGLTRVITGDYVEEDGVQALASSAPALERLRLSHQEICAATAATLRRLPRLTALAAGPITENAWRLLPCAQLTLLRTEDSLPPLPVLSALSFFRLVALTCESLPFDCLPALAAAAPALRLLSCKAEGDWGPTPAVFPCLEKANFYHDPEGRCSFENVQLASMAPALQHLSLWVPPSTEPAAALITGLSRLQSLHAIPGPRFTRADFEALAALHSLTGLACICAADCPALLPRLTSLRAAYLCFEPRAPLLCMGDALLAAAGASALHTLMLGDFGMPATYTLDAGSLLAFARARRCGLRTLSLRGAAPLAPADVALLCAQSSLQTLEVVSVRGGRDDFQEVITRARAAGGPVICLGHVINAFVAAHDIYREYMDM